MKKTSVKIISAALIFAMALSAAACGKKKEENGVGVNEVSHSGRKITSDSPWFECSKTEITPTFNPDKQVQSAYSSVAGCDDNYIVVLTNGNYKVPDNMDWEKYNNKDFGIAVYTVIDRKTKQAVKTIDMMALMDASDYIQSSSFEDGKITAKCSHYDPETGYLTTVESVIDAVSGNVVDTRNIDNADNDGGSLARSFEVGNYVIDAYVYWSQNQYYKFLITSGGDKKEAELKVEGKSVYDVMAMLPLSEDKALVPVAIDNGNAFYELDLKSGALKELDSKDFDWLDPTYLYTVKAGKDGMYYYQSLSGIAKIDMNKKSSEMAFNYSWCGENRSRLSNLQIGECTGDKVLLCGETGSYTAYGSAAIRPFCIMEFTRVQNPHAGKTIMELYSPYGYVNEKIGDAVNEFNNTNKEYFIEVSSRYTGNEYYEYPTSMNSNDEYEAASLNGDAKLSNKLAMDLINGDGPDILMDVSNFGQLNNKNYLVDLNQYIGTLDSEKYFTNIIDGAKVDGALYQLPLCFAVQGIHTDAKYAGASGIGFTTKEYEKFLKDELNGKDAIPSGQTLYFSKLFSAMSDKFIANGKADFTCQEFTELAEFVKNNVQEKASNWNDGTSDGPLTAPVGIAFKGDVSGNAGKKAFLTTCYGTGSYFYNIADCNGGTAILGIPSSDGRGPAFVPHVSVAISAQAVNKDAAAEFVKLLLSDDVMYSLALNDEFVISRAAFEKSAGEALDFYSKGEGVNYFGQYSQKMSLSKQNIDDLEKIILSCSRSNATDASINLILVEEMPAYFLGQKDLASVVTIAQDRVQKVLDERG